MEDGERVSFHFNILEIVVGEERANLNCQVIYLVQFTRLICRGRIRNKTGVLRGSAQYILPVFFEVSHFSRF
jgi:hypothetical protein